jgi:hypothetical protein
LGSTASSIANLDKSRPWTARELALIRRIPCLTQEHLDWLARIRAQFDAEIVAIETLGPLKDSERHAHA